MHNERAEQIVVRGLGEMLRRILEQTSVDLSDHVRELSETEPLTPGDVPSPQAPEPPPVPAEAGLAPRVRPLRQPVHKPTLRRPTHQPTPQADDINEIFWHRALRAPSSFDEETRYATAWLESQLGAR